MLHDVADALAYGHSHGVYHGDLRLDNIYVENGRALVAELGIRSALNAALGSEGGMDERADVHALAVAGQQMVAGRVGPTSAVLARALSIDPGEQYRDANAFREALGPPPIIEGATGGAGASRWGRLSPPSWHWRCGPSIAVAGCWTRTWSRWRRWTDSTRSTTSGAKAW